MIGQKEAAKNVPCTGMAGGKGRRAYGLSFLWRALYERGAELIEWRSAQKRGGMSGLFCPEIFGILNMKETVCTVCTEGGIR